MDITSISGTVQRYGNKISGKKYEEGRLYGKEDIFYSNIMLYVISNI